MTVANKLIPSEIPARVAGICSHPSRMQGKKGFTLLEVLVAAGAIFAIGVAMSTMISGCDPIHRVRGFWHGLQINPLSKASHMMEIDRRQQEIAKDVEGNKTEVAALRERLSRLEAEFAKYREMNPLPAEAPQRRNVAAPVPTPR